MKRETAYGQAATGNYLRMPFNRCNLGSEQGLIDDPVLGQPAFTCSSSVGMVLIPQPVSSTSMNRNSPGVHGAGRRSAGESIVGLPPQEHSRHLSHGVAP
jgi:hypothetical protein